MILILIPITFFSAPDAFAQTAPPPPESLGSAKGVAVSPGWNYFTLDFENCAAQKLIDELQADAGSGIAVDNLWVKQADDSWAEYTSVNPDSATAAIAPGQTVALSSSGKFYFDLTAGQCQQTDANRQNQILGLRAAAAGSSSDESLLDKLARVPQDFWNGLIGAFKFAKADGDLEFSKTATLDRLTVTDQANFGATAIGGPLTVGLLNFDDIKASIQALGQPLRLQPTPLTGVEFMGGLIKIDKSGRLIGNSSFRGSVTMPAGEGSVRMETSWDAVPVTINVTPTWNTNVWIEDLDKTGFTINISQAPASDSKLFWLALW